MEIATHPDDLHIINAELKDSPGKWYLGFFRGRGHNYKALLTSDDPRSWADSREENLVRIKEILITESLRALYHSKAPANLDEFVLEARRWGFSDEWLDADTEVISRVYTLLVEKGKPFLGDLIDPYRCLNAPMISEIMGRLQTQDTLDTSTEPLSAFKGEPTSPAHRLEFWKNLAKR